MWFWGSIPRLGWWWLFIITRQLGDSDSSIRGFYPLGLCIGKIWDTSPVFACTSVHKGHINNLSYRTRTRASNALLVLVVSLMKLVRDQTAPPQVPAMRLCHVERICYSMLQAVTADTSRCLLVTHRLFPPLSRARLLSNFSLSKIGEKCTIIQ